MFTNFTEILSNASLGARVALVVGLLLGGVSAVGVQGFASAATADSCNNQACSVVCVPPYGCNGECFDFAGRDCAGGNCTKSFPCGPM